MRMAMAMRMVVIVRVPPQLARLEDSLHSMVVNMLAIQHLFDSQVVLNEQPLFTKSSLKMQVANHPANPRALYGFFQGY